MLRIRKGKLLGKVVAARDKVLQTVRLGDKVEVLAKLVAVPLNLDCLDKDKRLKPQSPCGKRKKRWNGEG